MVGEEDERYFESRAQRALAMLSRARWAVRDAAQVTPDPATRALLKQAEAACLAAQERQHAALARFREGGSGSAG